MKHLILLIALISFSANAQKKMILIEGFDKQEISVTDSLTHAAVKEFYWRSNKNRVDFETDHCEKSLLADLFTARHFLEKYKVIQAKFETIERTKDFIAKYN